MVARFILSLDCEGKWGVADHLTPADHEALDDARLREAYAGILEVLGAFDIPATFAFVGTFSLSAERLAALTPGLTDLARDLPGYLEPALADLRDGTRQGWTGDWAVEAVDASRTGHEIALHGATHIPWNWPGMSADMARRELGLIYEAKAPILARTTTFIYPRNADGHDAVLDEFGIAGRRLHRGARSRLASLASEFNLFEQPEAVPPPTIPLGIPAGYFLNWLSGGRRLVPTAVSRQRARSLLRRAAVTGEAVHYWTHPENIASAPATLGLLRGVLEDVARMRDAGQCEVLTQDSWCRRIDPAHVALCEARRDERLS